MYLRKLRPLFLPDTVLLGLTDIFFFPRWPSFTFSLSHLRVQIPVFPKFGNFLSGYSIVQLNCCGLCRPVLLYYCHGPTALSYYPSLYSSPVFRPVRVTNVYGDNHVMTFAGDKRFVLVYVGQVFWRGMQQREWEAASVFITGTWNGIQVMGRYSAVRAPPPTNFSSSCSSLSTLLPYTPLHSYSIYVRMNIDIDNVC